jgi:YHS domain-containing protein/copper chaperone CopZ
MEVDPGTAAAVHTYIGQTFYFCSQNCAEQFDADPHCFVVPALGEAPLAGSITTGFNPALPLARVELPVIGLKGIADQRAIEARLVASPGVAAVNANPATGVARVEYDPQAVALPGLTAALHQAGYHAGAA